VCSVLLP